MGLTRHLIRQFWIVVIRERAALVWMFVVPCIYIFIFGSAFRGGNDPGRSRADLAVDNGDDGFLSRRLIAFIGSENVALDSANSVFEGKRSGAAAGKTGKGSGWEPFRTLVIRTGFTDSLLKGRTVHLSMKKRPDSNLEAEQTALMAVRKASFRLLADAAEVSASGKRIVPKTLSGMDGRTPLITVRSSYAGRHSVIPSGFSQQVPANLVQFGMIFLFVYAGSFVYEERRKGVLKRIRTAPVGFRHIFISKLAGATTLGMVQAGLLLLIGRFGFGVYYGSSPAGLVLLVAAYCVCIAAMGLCLGFAVKQHDKMIGIAIGSGLFMAAVSGCWWPLEVAPPWMQKAALVLPSGIALRGLHLLISYGRSFESVVPHIVGLVGLGAGFTLLFSTLLKRHQN
jgi:ABC-2 type transport system permease protein